MVSRCRLPDNQSCVGAEPVAELGSEFGYLFDHATPIGEIVVAATAASNPSEAASNFPPSRLLERRLFQAPMRRSAARTAARSTVALVGLVVLPSNTIDMRRPFEVATTSR